MTLGLTLDLSKPCFPRLNNGAALRWQSRNMAPLPQHALLLSVAVNGLRCPQSVLSEQMVGWPDYEVSLGGQAHEALTPRLLLLLLPVSVVTIAFKCSCGGSNPRPTPPHTVLGEKEAQRGYVACCGHPAVPTW